MISFDGTASTWAFGIIVFAIGLGLGGLATYLVIARNDRTRELQEELNLLKERFTDYRDQVTQHFMRTSELVQEMTRSYRTVYEHLANGAQHLCSDEVDIDRLESSARGRLKDAGQESTAGHEGRSSVDEGDYLVEDIDPEDLLGDSPRVPDLDIESLARTRQPLQH
jgi:uncharacterized membrane-anchored protein YhcB (DUF1043 family)